MDILLRLYAKRLPEPATLSGGNEVALVSRNMDGYWSTLLAGARSRLPLDKGEDLLEAIPWLEHGGPCIRQISVESVIPRIGFDRQPSRYRNARS